MIILDTNMLLVPGQFHVDIIKQIKEFDTQLATLKNSIEELKKLSKSNKKDARNANIGLQLVEKNNIKIIGGQKGNNTDEKILNCAKKNDYKVATNDRKLIEKLKKNNIKVIRLRQKKYLTEE